MKLGKKIQHYRKKRALSQEALGKQLFVTRQTVSLWEKDQTLPSLDNIVRLADIFGITVDELLSDREAEADGEGADSTAADSKAPIIAAPASSSTREDSGKTKVEKTKKLSRRTTAVIIASALVLALGILITVLVFSSSAALSDRRISRAIATELPEYEKKVALNSSGKPGGVISVAEITFDGDVFDELSPFMSVDEPNGLSDMLSQSFLYTGGSLYCLYNEDLGERTVSKFEAKYLLAVYYRESNMLRVTEFEY